MTLDKIHHIAIIASNYERSRDFYVNKLGFKLLRDNFRPERNDHKLDLRLGDCEIELFVMPSSPTRTTNPEACGLRHLAFLVDNIESCVLALANLGIECEPIRLDAFTGKKATFFMDPDGLPLELHE